MDEILIKNLLIKGQPQEESTPRAPGALQYKELATDIEGHVYIGDKDGVPQKVGNDEALTMALEEQSDPVIVKTNADLLQGHPAEDFVLKEDKAAIITTFTHSKSGNVHNFIGEGENGRALLTANIEEGDIFAVNGQNVSAFMGSEPALDIMVGSEWAGKWISFIVGEGILNFNSGGGKVTVSGLAANKILQGTTVTVKQGAKMVASAAGSIPSKAAATYTPKTTNQTIAAGQYLSGAQTIKGDSNLISKNIVEGRTIFGVTGNALNKSYFGGNTLSYGGDNWLAIGCINVGDSQVSLYRAEGNMFSTVAPRTFFVSEPMFGTVYGINIGRSCTVRVESGSFVYNSITYSSGKTFSYTGGVIYSLSKTDAVLSF